MNLIEIVDIVSSYENTAEMLCDQEGVLIDCLNDLLWDHDEYAEFTIERQVQVLQSLINMIVEEEPAEDHPRRKMIMQKIRFSAFFLKQCNISSNKPEKDEDGNFDQD